MSSLIAARISAQILTTTDPFKRAQLRALYTNLTKCQTPLNKAKQEADWLVRWHEAMMPSKAADGMLKTYRIIYNMPPYGAAAQDTVK